MLIRLHVKPNSGPEVNSALNTERSESDGLKGWEKGCAFLYRIHTITEQNNSHRNLPQILVLLIWKLVI